MKTFNYRNIKFNIFHQKDNDLVIARYKGKMRACYVNETSYTYETNKEKREAYEGIKKVHEVHIRIANKNKVRKTLYKKAM
jgi:hypothetical protein